MAHGGQKLALGKGGRLSAFTRQLKFGEIDPKADGVAICCFAVQDAQGLAVTVLLQQGPFTGLACRQPFLDPLVDSPNRLGVGALFCAAADERLIAHPRYDQVRHMSIQMFVLFCAKNQSILRVENDKCLVNGLNGGAQQGFGTLSSLFLLFACGNVTLDRNPVGKPASGIGDRNNREFAPEFSTAFGVVEYLDANGLPVAHCAAYSVQRAAVRFGALQHAWRVANRFFSRVTCGALKRFVDKHNPGARQVDGCRLRDQHDVVGVLQTALKQFKCCHGFLAFGDVPGDAMNQSPPLDDHAARCHFHVNHTAIRAAVFPLQNCTGLNRQQLVHQGVTKPDIRLGASAGGAKAAHSSRVQPQHAQKRGIGLHQQPIVIQRADAVNRGG